MQKNLETCKRDKITHESTMQAYCRHFFIKIYEFCQFGKLSKFQKLAILSIRPFQSWAVLPVHGYLFNVSCTDILRFGKFQKFTIWRISEIYNFKN